MNKFNIDRIIYKNIQSNKPIENLVNIGLSYSFLAKRYNEMLKNEEIIIKDKQFVLTELGKNNLAILEKNINKNPFIEPFDVYKIDKIDKYSIYLP